MKTCCHCKEKKSFNEFGLLHSTKDGYRPRCKVCAKVYRDRYKVSDAGKLAKDRYNKSESARDSHKRYYAKSPEKRITHNAFKVAIESGLLTRLPCVITGLKAEGHHYDYSLPLKVIWLSRTEHVMLHKELGELAAGKPESYSACMDWVGMRKKTYPPMREVN